MWLRQTCSRRWVRVISIQRILSTRGNLRAASFPEREAHKSRRGLAPTQASKEGWPRRRAQVLLAPSSSSLSLGFCPETAALPYAFSGDGNNASMTLARLDREHLHRWLKAAVLGAALCSAASSAEAESQPHTMPVLRTPPRSQSPLGAAAGAPPLPKPLGAADAKDPMTGLKSGLTTLRSSP